MRFIFFEFRGFFCTFAAKFCKTAFQILPNLSFTFYIMKSLNTICAFIAGSFILVACQEYDLERTEEVAYRHNYESNFVKTFGNVDPNQSWDLTSYAKHQRYMDGLTRAYTEYTTVANDGDYYRVEDATLSWLKRNLPESSNNSSEIKANVFRTEDEAAVFEVVPIYQGVSDLTWDLWICIKEDGKEDVTTNLWSKGQNIQRYYDPLLGSGAWHNVGENGNTRFFTDAVRSKPIRVDIPKYSTFYFYLQNTNNTLLYGTEGMTNSSIDNPVQIGALTDLPRPTNIREDYSAVVLACEDVKRSRFFSDEDFNDMVFLLTGYVPEIIYNDETRYTYIKKRYLIEDFGAFDYDFNDIVVDVTQTTAQVYTINSETGEATPKEGSSPVVTQEAKISSLCGSLPFQVKVGDTYFGQVTNPTASVADIEAQLARGASEHGGTVCPSGTRPAGVPLTYTKVIENNTWNPTTNNVSAFVWTNRDPSVDPADNSASGIWESTFPLDGEVPYIIAVDQDVVPDGEGVRFSGITVATE